MPTLTTLISLADVENEFDFAQEVANPHDLLMKDIVLHTDAKRFMLKQARQFPVVNGASRGVRRTKSNVTMDVDVLNVLGDGNITSPLVARLDCSHPVGTASADTDKLVACLALYVQSPEFRALLTSGELANV